MQIDDNFEIEDEVSGLKIKVIRGEKMDRLHIERISDPIDNRDFYFLKDGKFDGTGSSVKIKKFGEKFMVYFYSGQTAIVYEQNKVFCGTWTTEDKDPASVIEAIIDFKAKELNSKDIVLTAFNAI